MVRSSISLYVKIIILACLVVGQSNVSATWVKTSLSTATNCLATSGGNIFAGTSNGVYLSSDNGTNWTTINNGIPSGILNIYSLFVSGINIFAGLAGPVYLSSNNGSSWTACGTTVSVL